MNKRDVEQEIIGLIPAAGQATRLAPLPCSKEIFPLGFRIAEDGISRPKAVCHYLLENMRLAGIGKAYFLLRSEKWDIPAYLGDGEIVDMNLGYLIVRLLHGVPYTLDQAYPFIRNAVVAVGYPDILFRPRDSYCRLLERLAKTGADMILGAVPCEDPRKGGMIEFDAQGRIHSIVEKPPTSNSKHSFCTLAWTPAFTEFLHSHLLQARRSQPVGGSPGSEPEVILAEVIQAAIDHGLRIEAEVFPDGDYLDIGTPTDIIKATRRLALQDLSGEAVDILDPP